MTSPSIATRPVPTFPMAPTPATYWGSKYQFRVAVNEMVSLVATNSLFSATYEHRDRGNLDDLSLEIGDKVRAYQIKHFTNQIEACYFFNPENQEGQKNVTLHIGKFFYGWLCWREDHPGQTVRIVLYSNAKAGADLSLCVEGDRFTEDFQNGQLPVLVKETTTKTVVKILQGFFQEKLGVTKDVSKSMWTQLGDDGYLVSYSNTKRLSDAFDAEQDEASWDWYDQVFRIQGIGRTMFQCLKQWKVQEEQAGRKNFYYELWNQGWRYLWEKDSNLFYKAGQEGAQNIFKQFLSSFEFQLNQKDLDELKEESCKKIRNLPFLSFPDEQTANNIYLLLCEYIEKWAKKKHPDGQAPKITNEKWAKKIKKLETPAGMLNRLQGYSEKTMQKLPHTTQGKFIFRDEWTQLHKAIKKGTKTIVYGESGTGKSSLVKSVILQERFATHLFFTVEEIVENNKLQKNIMSASKHIQVLVLDGAETLLNLQDQKRKEFIAWLEALKCPLVLTITKSAKERLGLVAATEICIGLLSQDMVLQHFPVFEKYQDIEGIMEMARLPFFLSLMAQDMDYVREGMREAQLVKRVIKGKDPHKKRNRKDTWVNLVVGKGLISCLQEMKEDKILADYQMAGDPSKLVSWHFTHDLFIEYGLIKNWRREKKVFRDRFWKEFRLMEFKEIGRSAFKRWFLMERAEFIAEWRQDWEAVLRLPYFGHILDVAIENDDGALFAGIISPFQPLFDSFETYSRNPTEGIEALREQTDLESFEEAISQLTTITSYESRELAIMNDASCVLESIFDLAAKLAAINKVFDLDGLINDYYLPPALNLIDFYRKYRDWAITKKISLRRVESNSLVENIKKAEQQVKILEAIDQRKEPQEKNLLSSSSVSEERDSGTYHDSDGDSSQSSSDETSSSSSRSDEESSESSSSSSFDWNEWNGISSSDEDDQPQEFLIPEDKHPLSKFVYSKNKYWNTGFFEEPRKTYWREDLDWGNVESYSDSNSDYEEQSEYPRSPVYLAAIENAPKCLSVLFSRSVNSDSTGGSEYGETPLHLAVLHGAKGATQALLEHDREYANQWDKWGETPLHNAAYTGRHEIAELLLQFEAEPNDMSNNGLSPYYIAIARLDAKMAKLLFTYGGKLDSDFPRIGENGYWGQENEVEEFLADFLDHLQRNLDQTRKQELEFLIPIALSVSRDFKMQFDKEGAWVDQWLITVLDCWCEHECYDQAVRFLLGDLRGRMNFLLQLSFRDQNQFFERMFSEVNDDEYQLIFNHAQQSKDQDLLEYMESSSVIHQRCHVQRALLRKGV